MPNYFVRKDILKELELQSNCTYCGIQVKLTIDHIIPRSKGGGNERNNLTMACLKCNIYKSDLLVDEFIKKAKNKRNFYYTEFIKFSSRYRRYNKRNKNHPEIPYIITKMKENIVEFKYFNSIIFFYYKKSRK